MSDRMTDMSAQDGARYVTYGLLTRAEAVAAYRKHCTYLIREAQESIARAEAGLAAPDSELHVVTYRGVWVQRNEREILV